MPLLLLLFYSVLGMAIQLVEVQGRRSEDGHQRYEQKETTKEKQFLNYIGTTSKSRVGRWAEADPDLRVRTEDGHQRYEQRSKNSRSEVLILSLIHI